MNSRLFIEKIENQIPLDLALKSDRVGFFGSCAPESFEISRVLVQMDYLPNAKKIIDDYTGYDLLILHHPPDVPPPIPTYVIHSNWDLVKGGACDALARCLHIRGSESLDPATGLGRVGTIRIGPIPLGRFARYVMRSLKIGALRAVNFSEDREISRVALVPGFGLTPHLIGIALSRDIDLFISGDLTHPGAVCAKNSDLVLLDGTHYATEFPGLLALGRLLEKIDPEVLVHVRDTGVPIGMYSDSYRPVSYRGVIPQ